MSEPSLLRITPAMVAADLDVIHYTPAERAEQGQRGWVTAWAGPDAVRVSHPDYGTGAVLDTLAGKLRHQRLGWTAEVQPDATIIVTRSPDLGPQYAG